ncbi:MULTISPECIES: carbohydrate ABC transporter permease [Rossellomorea]|uniref:ABC transporter permease n=1 Tax=Rossellomorea marisflavi TaxID=189381 RepID=A0A0J5VC04_9BACI|nr:sugar ABC transporter permease [Rossellomorea marisflavi]MBV6682228.1 sugar ABC transporter permease [Bacillus sp. JRC01]KML08187.1 ABC transporter permease [Rossellomorea marisflavi]KML34639.1 ABC transporter permease [Rossellomorea marisflavi]KZE44436.1 ABC transporter permease [Rossellomorea marisflavi]TYO68981.1 sugar ABC transporter permease [Rossellomorea marisflavi]
MTLIEPKTNSESFIAVPQKRSFGARVKREWNKNAIVYVFLIPILIHFFIFQIFPFAFSFVLTFLDWKIIGDPEFVGLKNWQRFLEDKLAWKAIWNTVLFSIYYIIPTMALGLILALIINSGVRMKALFKGIFFLPVVTSFVIIAGIWGWLFRGTESGMINYLLSFIGVDTQLFLADSSQALLVLAGLSVFKVAGSTMIYYFAGLQSVDKQLYESARIDGASPMRIFWSITFPLLKPIHFYVAIVTTIGSFQIFDSTFLLTGGGPNYATTTIVFYLYQQGFGGLNLSYAAVLSYVLFFIILFISLIQRRYMGKETKYY